jgi:SAM-dependent methyltransferase
VAAGSAVRLFRMPGERAMDTQPQQVYWDEIAEEYQRLTRISTDDFHFGPLLPGDLELQILPEITSGMSCLELGCGAAQNSIALARRGAVCTAIDISSHQIQHAAQLAAAAKVDIELHCLPLEETLDCLAVNMTLYTRSLHCRSLQTRRDSCGREPPRYRRAEHFSLRLPTRCSAESGSRWRTKRWESFSRHTSSQTMICAKRQTVESSVRPPIPSR